MPSVRLKYLAPICDIAGRWEEEVTVPEGTTLRGMIEDTLCPRYGRDFARLFYDRAGNFRPQFMIRCAGEYVDDLNMVVTDGQYFAFIPPLAGG